MENRTFVDMASNLDINKPFMAGQITDIVYDLKLRLQEQGLVDLRKIKNIYKMRKSELSTCLLANLTIDDSVSFGKFVACLRYFKKNRLAEILENNGITVEVNVSFEDNFESKYYLQGFVSKLNTINSYAGSKQKKVGEVISWLKDSNTEILESVQLNNLSILIWICCWSEDGLDRMKSMAESGELLSQFNKLFECLTYLSRQIKPTYVHLDDAQLKYKKKDQKEVNLRSLDSPHENISKLEKSTESIQRRLQHLLTEENYAICKICFSETRLVNNFCRECRNHAHAGVETQQFKAETIEPTDTIAQSPVSEELIPLAMKESDQSSSTGSEDPIFDMILNRLVMDEYYPHKLHWIDVVTIDSSTPKSSETSCLNKVRALMRLDYITPYMNMPSFIEINDSREVLRGIDDLNQQITDEAACLHPMDVFNVIFNCCDPNLLQILMWKLFQCQLSIPFIFPNLNIGMHTCLLWALRMIVPECKVASENSEKRILSLVDIPLPVVSFMRIGDLGQSKSSMLNDILRSGTSHNTFFHRDCEYGGTERRISNGTIEATWFQPSGSRNDNFHKMFTILNLRGDASDHPHLAAVVNTITCLNILMIATEALKEKSYKRVIDACKKPESSFVVIFIAGSLRDGNKHNVECQECIRYLNEHNFQLFRVLHNWTAKEFLNGNRRKKILQEVICDYFKESSLKKTLVGMVIKVRDYNRICEQKIFHIDEDDHSCKQALLSTQPIYDSLYSIHSTEQRKLLLPLQGELWKNVTEIQKRRRRGVFNNIRIENVLAGIDTEHTKARRDQFELFQHSYSTFMERIYEVLLQSHKQSDMQYTVNWLKLYLDNNSRLVLPGMHANYQTKWNDYQQLSYSMHPDERKTQQDELSDIAQTISNASLGIEHVFRELGQIFEAVKFTPNEETVKNRIIRSRAMSLPDLMAELVLQGCSLEIMDGETAFIPITWIKAVLKSIQEKIRNKKIFVISIVGIQSSGKSTFLNTMFGLQFAVSAGRCTRGVYCQMIPVNNRHMQVDYDYVLVVDTEGLGAPELQDTGSNHDNELATFVIGLGNVTIVNIKGETDPSLQNVLQIVIHAMLRIKFLSKVQLNPSCVFVHQNVSAVDAEEKLKFGKEKLLRMLDRVTEAAAAQEQIENIQQFKQVINYDEYKHAFYMPDLWQGNPPMAPVNNGYSERIYEIRQLLINDISKHSTASTLDTFVSKLEDLWNGILCENFVFNFKNSEEVRAFSFLDKFFSKLVWELQKESSKIQKQLTNQVFSPSVNFCDEFEERLVSNVAKRIHDSLGRLQVELANHFNNDSNKDILEQWRERYSRRLTSLAEDEQNRINKVISEYSKLKILRMKTNEEFDKIKLEIMREIEKQAVDFKKQIQSLEEEDMKKYFVRVWRSILTKLQSRSETSNDIDVVEADIKNALLNSSFRTHMQLLERELSTTLVDLKNHSYNSFMPVDRDDMVFKVTTIQKIKGFLHVFNSKKKEKYFKTQCTISAQEKCNQIFLQAKKYVEDLVGQDFQPGQVHNVIRMTEDFFQKLDTEQEKSGYSFSYPFRIRFTVYICKCVANEFAKLRTIFRETSNPIARISDYRLPFYQFFKCQCNEIENDSNDKENASSVAACFIEWIAQALSNNYDQILMDLIVKDSMFDDKYAFTKKILTDLLIKKDFDIYQEYVYKEEIFVMNTVRSLVENWREYANANKSNFDSRIRTEIRKHKARLLESMKKLKGPYLDLESYLKELGQDLQNKIPYDAKFVQTIQVANFDNFTENVMHLIKNDATEASYFIKKANASSEFVISKIFNKVNGCRSKCPFCTAPCCLSENDHFGDHQVLQHYPLGLAGIEHSGKLCTFNCQTVINTDLNYTFDHNNPLESTHPIRDYKKYHRKWDIKPDISSETSLYWKWFMAYFNDDLAHYHSCSPADIPETWQNITIEMAKKSLDNF